MIVGVQAYSGRTMQRMIVSLHKLLKKWKTTYCTVYGKRYVHNRQKVKASRGTVENKHLKVHKHEIILNFFLPKSNP